ncbi:sulfatase-like hydrolase/transferase [Coxiella-like endosymbiont of Rhipicephalus sanguineus]|uniref:sulfatase-like hydrolase/transferase n=1 Tax=Coxiella-like endosymbiont of Rhipicephalus sanguineus TaxID=1955402 RepID=UPI00203CF867|nr:sulfatase-like hydrolase/transferase [Coxiella-like endosymbiont of Rhipicephalus sanguineus]
MQTLRNSTVACDRAITREFDQFLKKRQQDRLFWGFILWRFILYDAVHNYCDPTTLDYKPFQLAVKQCDCFSLTPNSDPIPYINRYYNAVYFLDSEVKKVLDDFKSHDLLKNTIVIITNTIVIITADQDQ